MVWVAAWSKRQKRRETVSLKGNVRPTGEMSRNDKQRKKEKAMLCVRFMEAEEDFTWS